MEIKMSLPKIQNQERLSTSKDGSLSTHVLTVIGPQHTFNKLDDP